MPGDPGVFRGFVGCPLGEGIVPNRSLLRRILETGYDGWISLECPPVTDPLGWVRRDAAALRGWLIG